LLVTSLDRQGKWRSAMRHAGMWRTSHCHRAGVKPPLEPDFRYPRDKYLWKAQIRGDASHILAWHGSYPRGHGWSRNSDEEVGRPPP